MIVYDKTCLEVVLVTVVVRWYLFTFMPRPSDQFDHLSTCPLSPPAQQTLNTAKLTYSTDVARCGKQRVVETIN